MQNSVVNQPFVGQQSYVLEHQQNPELIVNKYDLNRPQPVTMPQAPVVSFQTAPKYPVTYKMRPPKIRPPTQIREETLVVKPPVQQVVTQPYVQNQQMLVQQPVTQFVPQPVSQQFVVQPDPAAYQVPMMAGYADPNLAVNPVYY